MSLLEDVFLQDEAGEAQELERVIDGDEYDERPRASSPDSDENSAKEDEAEEDKRRVDPTQSKPKRVVKNPRFILNPARLTGPRGIQVIPEHFKDFKFKGKGHEKEDLDLVLKKLEHWAYRLYPKFQFEDCLKKIESLGRKRPVMVHLHKIRTDQFVSEETVIQKDSSDDEAPTPTAEEDEFDKLLQQQIDLARATPAPKKPGFDAPKHDVSLTMPKATSSPSISDEQRERILRNRRLAEERRIAKLKQSDIPERATDIDAELDKTQQGKSSNINNTSDSSDDECDVAAVNQSVVADVHDASNREIIEKTSDNDVKYSNNSDFNKVCEVIDVEGGNITDRQGNELSKINTMNSSILDKSSNKQFDHCDLTLEIKNNDGNCKDLAMEVGKEFERNHCDDSVIESDLGKCISIKDGNMKNSDQCIENANIEFENNGEGESGVAKTGGENLAIQSTAIYEVDKLVDEEIMDIDFSDDF